MPPQISFHRPRRFFLCSQLYVAHWFRCRSFLSPTGHFYLPWFGLYITGVHTRWSRFVIDDVSLRHSIEALGTSYTLAVHDGATSNPARPLTYEWRGAVAGCTPGNRANDEITIGVCTSRTSGTEVSGFWLPHPLRILLRPRNDNLINLIPSL